MRQCFIDAKANNSTLNPHATGAFYQTAGTGRLNRQWVSPPNTSLLISALVPLDIGSSDKYANALGVLAGLATQQACEAILKDVGNANCELKIKWPNDILAVLSWDVYKLSGIKTEFLGEYQGQNWYSIGVGVNVWQIADDLSLEAKIPPTSLLQLCPNMSKVANSEHRQYIIRLGEVFVTAFLTLYERHLTNDNIASLRSELTKHLYLNHPLTVHLADGAVVSGVGVGIDDNFNLRLRSSGVDGEELLITVGDVTPIA